MLVRPNVDVLNLITGKGVSARFPDCKGIFSPLQSTNNLWRETLRCCEYLVS